MSLVIQRSTDRGSVHIPECPFLAVKNLTIELVAFLVNSAQQKRRIRINAGNENRKENDRNIKWEMNSSLSFLSPSHNDDEYERTKQWMDEGVQSGWRVQLKISFHWRKASITKTSQLMWLLMPWRQTTDRISRVESYVNYIAFNALKLKEQLGIIILICLA